MSETEKKKETPTLAPPAGQDEDIYSASTVVGQAPAEILALIAASKAASAELSPATAPAFSPTAPKPLPEPPPSVLVETPAAFKLPADFSVPASAPLPTGVGVVGVGGGGGVSALGSIDVDLPESPAPLSSRDEIDDDDWLVPDEAAKPAPAPPHAPQPPPPARSNTEPVPGAPPVPVSRVPSRPAHHELHEQAPSAHPSVAPMVGAVLGLVEPPEGVPEERTSAAKLVAAVADPNIEVVRVPDEILSVRVPVTEPIQVAEAAAALAGGASGSNGAIGESGAHGPHGSLQGIHGGSLSSRPPPPLGDGLHGAPASIGDPSGVPSSHNPMHLPIAAAPNSMHVPIAEPKVPSRAPVGLLIVFGVVFVLAALGGIVFSILHK